MSKKLSPPLGSYEGDPLMPDQRDKHIADLEQQLSALQGLLRQIYDSQAVTNNKAIDIERWTGDTLAALKEVG